MNLSISIKLGMLPFVHLLVQYTVLMEIWEIQIVVLAERSNI